MSSARVFGFLTASAALTCVAGAARPWVPVSDATVQMQQCEVDRLERMLFPMLPVEQRIAITGGLIREAGPAIKSIEERVASGLTGHALIADLISEEAYNAMRPEWKRAMEALATGTGNGAATCFAPDTPMEVVEAFEALMALDQNRFQIGTRWGATALSGGGLGQGDPTIITYGYATDGTFIPDSSFGNGNSDLFAWLNGIYGSPANWQPLFDQVFDRWEELSGNTYVYEPNDDGANHGPNSNNGIPGVRADVRIAAKRIDGNSGVLAYNFFPNNGDMVLDSDDSFYNNTGGNSLRLRNIIAHEHGHGKGMAHVCPANQTKLMEPFISTQYDGPQLDDRLHAQRQYGDVNEPNDNAAVATDLGEPFFLSLGQLSIDDNSDSDWYRVELSEPSQLTVQITATGETYLDGPQNNNGSCSAGTNFDSLRIHDLAVDIVASNGFSVLQSTDETGLGGAESVVFVAEDAGVYYIQVRGDSTNNIQAYNLFATVDELPFIPARIQAVGTFPEAIEPGVATPVLVSIDANDEIVSSQVLRFRADGGAFVSIPLQPAGGMNFTANLPPVLCGDNPEFFFQITGDQSGIISLPSGGAAAALTAIVGEVTIDFDDNFQTDQGWSVGGSIATAGAGRWQRGVPAGGFDERVADPAEDADGSGQCYVTGNVSGNSDVDGGNTTLTSPAFQLADQPEAIVSYSRWFDNNEGGSAANPFQETFLVEISNNGGSSWVTLETVGPNGPEVSGGWFDKSFRVADFVAPTNNVRIRFTASDDVGTVVEAGVDAVRVEGVTCEDPTGGPCSAGDLAIPFGVLDLADINAFVAGFTSQDPVADLAAPFGILDLADINAFVAAFVGGCP